MKSRLLMLGSVITLSFILVLAASTNVSAVESGYIIKVDRGYIKKEDSKRRHHHHDNRRFKRNHDRGHRHKPRHKRHHNHHHRRHHNDWWDYKGDYRPRRYRPWSGFTYYSDHDHWGDDRLDLILRYRWYD